MDLPAGFLPLTEAAIEGKRLFLRADLNVPLKSGVVQNDFRLRALLPTLEHLRSRNCSVVLGTHIGRPQAVDHTNFYDESLSTKHLLAPLRSHGFAFTLERDLKAAARALRASDTPSLLLLENLRFFNGEKEPSAPFAQLLAPLADIYINDAFALAHRHDTSVTLLPEQFPLDGRLFGRLFVREITALQKLTNNPAKPFVILVGGNKVADKLAFLTDLVALPQSRRPTALLIGGALAYPLLYVAGTSVDVMYREKELLYAAQKLTDVCAQQGVSLHLPVDHRVTAHEGGSVEVCDEAAIAGGMIGVDIGPRTVELFGTILQTARTVFANGTMGKYEDDAMVTGTEKLFVQLAKSDAYTVVGGGDGVTAAQKCGYADSIDFLSTGGGATLAFLATNNPFTDLPALASMTKE